VARPSSARISAAIARISTSPNVSSAATDSSHDPFAAASGVQSSDRFTGMPAARACSTSSCVEALRATPSATDAGPSGRRRPGPPRVRVLGDVLDRDVAVLDVAEVALPQQGHDVVVARLRIGGPPHDLGERAELLRLEPSRRVSSRTPSAWKRNASESSFAAL